MGGVKVGHFGFGCDARHGAAARANTSRILSGGFGGLERAALCQAVALAVHLEDVDLVGQPVGERAGPTYLIRR